MYPEGTVEKSLKVIRRKHRCRISGATPQFRAYCTPACAAPMEETCKGGQPHFLNVSNYLLSTSGIESQIYWITTIWMNERCNLTVIASISRSFVKDVTSVMARIDSASVVINSSNQAERDIRDIQLFIYQYTSPVFIPNNSSIESIDYKN